MPTVNVTFADSSDQNILMLDNNADVTVGWANSCTQKSPLTNNAACTAAPTNLTLGYDTTSLTTDLGDFTSLTQGGYTFSGSVFQNTLSLYLSNLTEAGTEQSFNISFATTVTGDAWMYNIETGAQGALGMNAYSQAMVAPLYGQEFLIILGNVANQTFAGGSYTEADPTLIAGDGDYSTYFTASSRNTVALNWTANANAVTNISFGEAE